MLEKYISSLFVPYVSEYVENIDTNKLKIDIWNGKASLHDLVLKPTALDLLLPSSASAEDGEVTKDTPPVQLFRGVCKKVSLNIPLKHLRSKPVIVEIGELLITLRTAYEEEDGQSTVGADKVRNKGDKWDRICVQKVRELEEFELERRQQRKVAAAATSADSMESAQSTSNRGGFFTQLGETIVNNIIVKVQTVHVRYEDPQNLVALGAILGGVQLLTVDETGQVAFIDPSGRQKTSKRLVFEGVQFYCDDPTRLTRHAEKSENGLGGWCSEMEDWEMWSQAMLRRAHDGNVPFSTLFGPVSGSLDLRLVFRRFARELLDTPYATLKTNFPKITARLSRAQYATIVSAISRLVNWRDVHEVASRRPKVPVKGNARVWWRYAIRTVLSAITEPRRKRLLQRISRSCLLDYQVLYREIMRKLELPPERKRTYRFITRFMTVQDMITGRKFVYAKLANELQLKRKDNEQKRSEFIAAQEQEQQSTQGTASSSGWGIMRWLRLAPAAAAADRTVADHVDEEEEFLKSLARDYEIDLSLDASNPESGGMAESNLPPSYTWLELGFDIPFMSYQIDFDHNEGPGKPSLDSLQSASLNFYELRGGVRVLNASSSYAFHFSVQNISLSNPSVASAAGLSVPFLIQGLTESPNTSTLNPLSSKTTSHVMGGAPSLLGTEEGGLMIPEFPSLRQILQLQPVKGEEDSQKDSNAGNGKPWLSAPLLSIGGALNPVEQPFEDTQLDVALRVLLQPLRIVTDTTILKRLVYFFDVPSGVDLSRLAMSTRRAASAMESAATENIRLAMTKVKGIFLSIDAAAPVILLPQTLQGSLQEPTMTISLGRIRFQTQPLSESGKRRQRLVDGRDSDEMLYHSNEASFSRFFLELTTLEGALQRPKTGLMLVPEVTIEANVMQLIEDGAGKRDRLILRLKVPNLRIAISLHQMYLLTNMIEVWISDLLEEAPRSSLELRGGSTDASALMEAATARKAQEVGNSFREIKQQTTAAEWRRGSSAGELHPSQARRESFAGSEAGFAPAVTAEKMLPFSNTNLSSRAGTAAEVGSSKPVDLPKLRVELYVESLGLDVYEDDPITLKPSAAPRFSLSFATAEMILGVRSVRSSLLLILREPSIIDCRVPDHGILFGGSVVCIGVELAAGEPTSVDVSVRSALTARVGTPLIELLEVLMDLINLSLSLSNRVSSKASLDDLGASIKATKRDHIHSKSDLLAYQLRQIREQCALPDTRVANIAIRLHGASTLELFNRRQGDTADYLLATASISEVNLYIRKNTITMKVKGSLGEFSARAAACQGLYADNVMLIQKTASAQDGGVGGPSLAKASSTAPSQSLSYPSPERGLSAAERANPYHSPQPSPREASPHLSFSFSKYKPVIPIFEVVEGRSKLTNASELRYSSALELELGASTVRLDMYTMMLLNTYFTTGFFSRISSLGDRPLYDCRELPPALESPHLLMNIHVVVSDMALTLLLDPRRSSESFKATLGHIVIQSSLYAANCQQVLNISLGGISLTREKVGREGAYHDFLPPHTSVEVALRSSIDPESTEAPQVNIQSEILDLSITAADFVDGCRFLRQNLSRAVVAPEMSVSEKPPARRVGILAASKDAAKDSLPPRLNQEKGEGTLTSQGASFEAPPHFTGEARGMNICLRCTKVILRFFEDEFSQTSNQFNVSGIILTVSSSQTVNLRWKSLGVLGVRGGESDSHILLCDEGSVSMDTLLTTRTALLQSFCAHTEPSYGGNSGTSLVTGKGTQRPASAFKPSTATDSEVVLKTTVISIDFTLRRFAVSSEWLSVYDFFVNEEVVREYGAEVVMEGPPSIASRQGAAEGASPSSESKQQSVSEKAPSSALSLFVRTPNVVVPFLTANHELIFEADITLLQVDVVNLPEGANIAVCVQKVEVVDIKSGRRLFYEHPIPVPSSGMPSSAQAFSTQAKQSDDFGKDYVKRVGVEGGEGVQAISEDISSVQHPNPVGGSLSFSSSNSRVGGRQAAHGSEPASDPSLGNHQRAPGDAVRIILRTNPAARKNTIEMNINQLDMLCAMSVIYGLVDYATAPSQPIAKIANLGVMKEQRERMMRAVNEIANTTVIGINIVWHQMRVVVVGDATDMKKQSRCMEVCLGTIKTDIEIDKSSDILSVVFKAHDLHIPDLLQKSALELIYKKNGPNMSARIDLERTVGLFLIKDVNYIMSVLHGNLLLPPTTHYYGDFSAVEEDEGEESARPHSEVSPLGVQKTDDTPAEVTCTVNLQMHGLIVEMYDFFGMHTHTFTISEVLLQRKPNGNLRICIPSINAVENFTNSLFLYTSKGSSSSRSSPTKAPAASRCSSGSSPLRAADAEHSIDRKEHALLIKMNAAKHATTVYLSRIVLVLVPRGVGTLVNMLMSMNHQGDLKVGDDDDGLAALNTSETATPGVAAGGKDSLVLSSKEHKKETVLKEEGVSQPPPPPTPSLPSATPGVVVKLIVKVAGCEVRFVQGNRDLAVARLVSAKCATETYDDGSKLINATLGDLNMEDFYHSDSLHKVFVLPYEDTEDTRKEPSQVRLPQHESDSRVALSSPSSAATSKASSPHITNMDGDATTTALTLPLSQPPKHLIEFSLRTYPPNSAQGDARNPSPLSYSKRLNCKVGSLSFTIVPDIVRLLVDALSEVQHYINAQNFSKVYEYMSDKAAEAAMIVNTEVNKELIDLSVVVNRPRIVLIDSPASSKGIEVFPGKLILKSGLVSHHGEPGQRDDDTEPSRDSSMQSLGSEIFRVSIKQMGMRFLDNDVLKGGCSLNMAYKRMVGETSGGRDERSDASFPHELSVSIAPLIMNLSRDQLNFGLDVAGSFLKGYDTTNDACTNEVSNVDTSQMSLSGNSSRRVTNTDTVPLTNPTFSSPSPFLQPRAPKAPQTAPTTSVVASRKDLESKALDGAVTAQPLHITLGIESLSADLAEVFRLQMEAFRFRMRASPDGDGTVSQLRMRQFTLQHVGAGARGVCEEGHDPCVDCPIDILSLHEIAVQTEGGVQRDTDAKDQSVSEQRNVHVSLGAMTVAMSPTALCDTQKLFYLPFRAKVLHIPDEPTPVLVLNKGETLLERDVILDSNHILLTPNPQRCCYELNLNEHRLVLTGPPSAQIVLSEGCELIITSGVIIIPGMYSIGSYVSFGTGASLKIAVDCQIQKQYLNLPENPLSTSCVASKSVSVASVPGQVVCGSIITAPDSNKTSLKKGFAMGTTPRTVDTIAREGSAREHHLRVVYDFYCPDLKAQLIFEGTPKLTLSLCMETKVVFTQESKDNVLVKRNASMQLLKVRSGEHEEYILLPTTVTGNFSGVDNVSVSVVFGSIELSFRTIFLGMFGKVIEDVRAVFDENAKKRAAPTVQLESNDFKQLVPSLTIGECRNCGGNNASLAETAARPGTLCYRCCIGRDSLPLSDFRCYVPLVDLILLSSGGELTHGRLCGVEFCLDPNMDLKTKFTSTLYNFNNSAGVWEPFLENFEANISGNILSHEFRFLIDRFDHVISPHNVRVLSLIMKDYNFIVVGNERSDGKLRKREEDPLAHDHRGHIVKNLGEPDVGHTTVVGTLSSSHDRDPIVMGENPPVSTLSGRSLQRKELLYYTRVEVENLCGMPLFVDSHLVESYAGKVSLTTPRRTVLVRRENPLDADDEGYLVSLVYPALYNHARGLLMEAVVEFSQGFLQRVVSLTVLPLHESGRLICIENRLGCALNLGYEHAALRPGGRFYLPADAKLRAPFIVQPEGVGNGDKYAPSVSLGKSSSPSIQEILCGSPISLRCSCVSRSAKDFIVYVKVHQAAIHGGVPSFMIALEARYRVRNQLPCTLMLNVSSDPKGDIVRRRTKPAHTESILLEPMQQSEFPLNALDIDQIACMIEAYQLSPDNTFEGKETKGSTRSSKPNSKLNVFVSSYTALESGYIGLISNQDEEMVIRVEVKRDNIIFSTPFCFLNHTSYRLTVSECNSEGTLRRLKRRRNYSVLEPGMDVSIPACSMHQGEDEFFVYFTVENLTSRMLPLHVQQGGLILLRDQPRRVSTRCGKSPSSGVEPTGGSPRVHHFEYLSKIDHNGAILVTITPRWVMVNRSRLTLYAFFSETGGRSTAETSAFKAVSSSKLQDIVEWEGNEAASTVLKLPPQTAVPVYETPYCAPEVGYSVYFLQSLQAPLHGMPVGLETIHSETIVAYGDGRGDPSLRSRDRFFEIALVARIPYTYVTIDERDLSPYIVLNRTRYRLIMEDISTKGKGRIIVNVEAGCVGELVVDPTNSTRMRVLVQSMEKGGFHRENGAEIIFDVSRPMTDEEWRKAPGRLRYRVGYGKNGQTVMEIIEVDVPFAIEHIVKAPEMTPLSIGLNMKLATVAVVMASKDLLFGAITDIRLSLNRQATFEVFEFSIKNFQFDNQAEDSPHYDSCLLALRTTEKGVAIAGTLKRAMTSAKDVLCIEELRLDVTPIALRVSDTLLIYLASFLEKVGASGSGEEATLLQHHIEEELLIGVQECPTNERLFKEAPLQMDFMATHVVLERFIVNPIQVRLWLTRDDDENDFIIDQIHMEGAALLSMLISSCEDVQITAPGVVCTKRTDRLGVLMEWLVKSYMDGLFAQIHGVLLQYASSLPLVGAPVKLATSISGGAVRLFIEPVEGLLTSPKAFAQGLASGSVGFAQSLAGGGLGAFANITDTGSRLLSIGGGVSERERRKQNTWTGLTSGLKGIVQRPVAGAAEAGTLGALKGTAQGLLGVLTNPVSGLLSDVSRATDTLAKLFGDAYIPETTRLRPVRDFYANGGVASWCSTVSTCQYERFDLSSRHWSAKALLSPLNEEEWSPGLREHFTYGPNHTQVPRSRWLLDCYNASFEGWAYSTKYNGTYIGVLIEKMRVRRKRWVALVRALPHAPIAFYLGVCPGMETATPLAVTSLANSVRQNPVKQGAETREFVPLSGIPACTLRVARTAASRGSDLPSSRSHIISDFLHDEAVHGSSVPPRRTPSTERAREICASPGDGDDDSRSESCSAAGILQDVVKPPPPIVSPSSTVVEVVEYQRKMPLLGWSKSSLPSKFPAWQDAHGREVPKPSDMKAPAGWGWQGSWTCTRSANDGWVVLPEDHSIRRRYWQRRLVKLDNTK